MIDITIRCPSEEAAKLFVEWLSETGEQDAELYFDYHGEGSVLFSLDYDGLTVTMREHE